VSWQSYQTDDGDVVYGGRPLGAVPASVPTGPKGSKCRRSRTARLRVRGVGRRKALRSLTVFVNGRRVARRRGAGLPGVVRLRRLPAGRVRVRVVAVTRSGRRLAQRRTYRVCASKRAKARTSVVRR
jgi:hypothetical protein